MFSFQTNSLNKPEKKSLIKTTEKELIEEKPAVLNLNPSNQLSQTSSHKRSSKPMESLNSQNFAKDSSEISVPSQKAINAF